MLAPDAYSAPAPGAPGGAPADADLAHTLAPNLDLVREWLNAPSDETARERLTATRLNGVVNDPQGVSFAMRLVDRVIRPDDAHTGAQQLAQLVRTTPVPRFLTPLDRTALKLGARSAWLWPRLAMALTQRRLRSMVGHLVVDARPQALAAHLAERRSEGFALNVNLLGEAVLGKAEADRRLAAALKLLAQPDVDYVSVKVSAIQAQINHWDAEAAASQVAARLKPLFLAAAASSPPTFINLDMEEYHDLELTVAAFRELLDQPELHGVEAGIVLQTYLPDAFSALQELTAWAQRRRAAGGAGIKIRLVKGANLAMERVESALQGWEQAPFTSKAATDASFVRCLNWALDPSRTSAVRLGVASHNLFDVAWAHLVAQQRGVSDRVEFEMLEGMAPPMARRVKETTGNLLLYTPVVAPADFEVAISYLFRRLEENAGAQNFIRHLFSLSADSPAFGAEAARFATALAEAATVSARPRRTQNRLLPPVPVVPTTAADGRAAGFANEPDTDPSLAPNRAWAATCVATPPTGCQEPMTDDLTSVDARLATVRAAQPAWAGLAPKRRRDVLYAVAGELARRRGELVSAMVHEASKTVGEADTEVSEAIDFARWYGDRALDLTSPTARFEPLGVVLVVPPWNFPVAIAAGGVLAALAAGNAVVLKPAPETPRCAELVAQACWAGGVPADALHFVRTPDNATGAHLVSHAGVDAVILTGSTQTAQFFASLRPGLRLFAETSGKNAMVVTPNADLDLAVADIVASAFGHAGQKCSATSLVIAVGEVYRSPRFWRQLEDAVRSIQVGPADHLATRMPPLAVDPTDRLTRALTQLEPGESWLVRPELIGPAESGNRQWTPGVRRGVAPGSWFHRTECFGPVLGVMPARSLAHAVALQNDTDFGLTAGLHSLDEAEISFWLERVEGGNAYVNRTTTGAIVGRQPFGGWKGSSVGPGAKAGGPHYVAQLGHWVSTEPLNPEIWAAADARAWATRFGPSHELTGLFCQSNELRYRPLPGVGVWVAGSSGQPEALALARIQSAARRCGTPLLPAQPGESAAAFIARLASAGVERVRVVGRPEDHLLRAATSAGVYLACGPVTNEARVELLNYLREQSISRTRHRYGNVL